MNSNNRYVCSRAIVQSFVLFQQFDRNRANAKPRTPKQIRPEHCRIETSPKRVNIPAETSASDIYPCPIRLSSVNKLTSYRSVPNSCCRVICRYWACSAASMLCYSIERYTPIPVVCDL